VILKINKWMTKKSYNNEKSMYSVQLRDPLQKTDGKIIVTGDLGINSQDTLAGISLLNTELDKVEFIDETWMHEDNDSNRRKIIVDETFFVQQIEQEGMPPIKVTRDQVAQVYRRLRENFEQAKRYSDAGDFLIGEMEVIRKFKPGSPTKHSKRAWHDSTKILYGLYYLLGKYGESISRPFLGSIFVLVGATVAYCNATLNQIGTTSKIEYFSQSLFKTVNAFFPFSRPLDPYDLLIKAIGTLLLGLTFISMRRRLERR